MEQVGHVVFQRVGLELLDQVEIPRVAGLSEPSCIALGVLGVFHAPARPFGAYIAAGPNEQINPTASQPWHRNAAMRSQPALEEPLQVPGDLACNP